MLRNKIDAAFVPDGTHGHAQTFPLVLLHNGGAPMCVKHGAVDHVSSEGGAQWKQHYLQELVRGTYFYISTHFEGHFESAFFMMTVGVCHLVL